MLSNTHDEPFPWHLNVYDAHCHPTDTMSTISSIPSMKTRVLTIMATRSQDQTLVSTVADDHSIQSRNPEDWKREECVIPCFGWHPWFAHHMYIPSPTTTTTTSSEPSNLQGDAKIAHYQSVLRPTRDSLSSSETELFASLPDPMPFSLFLHETEAYLEKYPFALVGEVGLDKSFRIPEPYTDTELALGLNRDEGLTPGGREGRKLSAFRVDKEHQKMIFKMQLQLAAKKGRGVSVHGVQAHGLVFDVLKELWAGHEREGSGSKRERRKQKQRSNNTGLADGEKSREVQVQGTNANTADGDANTVNAEPEKDKKIDPPPYPPRICLHSYSGNPSSFSQYLSPTNSIPIQIFASFSTAINLSDIPSEEETPQSFADMVRMVPDHMVLVESDLHIAGEDMDNRMEDIVRRVCGVKGWALDEGVRKLGENWRRFVFG